MKILDRYETMRENDCFHPVNMISASPYRRRQCRGVRGYNELDKAIR